jgi:formylglycine-generating enzyme required for sulfatase activity
MKNKANTTPQAPRTARLRKAASLVLGLSLACVNAQGYGPSVPVPAPPPPPPAPVGPPAETTAQKQAREAKELTNARIARRAKEEKERADKAEADLAEVQASTRAAQARADKAEAALKALQAAALKPAASPVVSPPPAPQAQQPGSVFKDCADCPELVVIASGSFSMGSNDYDDEKPIHRVNIKAFAMGKTEVTQAQWLAVMGSNPSSFKECGPTCPVEQVSWDDAQQFIQRLNAKTGQRYRLPSEAEWEYAARAGTSTKYWWGDQASHEYANYGKDDCCGGLAQGRDKWVNTAPPAQFPANAFGLHDMHGNVWEWVEDCWHTSYTSAPSDGSAWTSNCSSTSRVLRGGSWDDYPRYLRSAVRNDDSPAFRSNIIGLRVARTLP